MPSPLPVGEGIDLDPPLRCRQTGNDQQGTRWLDLPEYAISRGSKSGNIVATQKIRSHRHDVLDVQIGGTQDT